MASGVPGTIKLAASTSSKIAYDSVQDYGPDPYSRAIHAVLQHLEKVGFTGAPRSFGWDKDGNHLVEFVPGTRADDPQSPAAALEPERVGDFLRRLHDALTGFVPPPDVAWFDGFDTPIGEIIAHQDISPANLVVRDNGELVAIDWDAAAPGSRLWDVAYAIHAFTPLYKATDDVPGAADRMAKFAAGYGLSAAQRRDLLPLLALRSERMFDYLNRMRHTGTSPWCELWDRGAGTIWKADAQWIRAHASAWEEALLGS